MTKDDISLRFYIITSLVLIVVWLLGQSRRFVASLSPFTRRCEWGRCTEPAYDTFWGGSYCRIHHPLYENPLGTETARNVPWTENGEKEP